MNLDVVVFLFGMLISTLVATGLLLVFYGYAYLEEAKRENIVLSPRMQRLARLLYGDEAP
jgi:hypothetical protein